MQIRYYYILLIEENTRMRNQIAEDGGICVDRHTCLTSPFADCITSHY